MGPIGYRAYLAVALFMSIPFWILTMGPIGYRAYLAVALFMSIPFWIGTSVAIETTRAAQCAISEKARSGFLAYCGQPKFGDYEHGAFWFGLEPDAIAALRKASVLFVGSSQAQVSFSTAATRAFFLQRHQSYYLMGFGYSEGNAFSSALINKYALHPKVMVITMGYPGTYLSLPAQASVSGSPGVYAEYWTKRMGQRLSRSLCDRIISCPRNYGAIYRRAQDGAWIWEDVLTPANYIYRMIGYAKPASPAEYNFARGSIQQFLTRTETSPSCTVITSAPNNHVDWNAEVSYVGKALGLTVVLPQLKDLATVDDSHLNKPSAERWSAEFFREATPVFDRCLR